MIIVLLLKQGQAERLIESERELCLLRGQLESLSAEHEARSHNQVLNC